MYIDSPMHESKNHEFDDEDYHHNTDEFYGHGHKNKDGDEESDDSMASDASSGPSHRKILCDSKHAENERLGKNHKQVEKKTVI